MSDNASALAKARDTFARWFGDDYELDALYAALAVAAVERFDDSSDTLWLLLVSGPGAAKTETVQAFSGIDATVTSSIASEAALLSATPKRERSKNATGGLLRKMGDSGVLVIKDVTSILSMNRDTRASVLAALREVYDRSWYREVGTDGGQTMEWKGRIAILGAVTTAWDTAHSVVSAMGDRFVLVRIDSTTGRRAAGRQAIRNTGSEAKMRAELAGAVHAVITAANTMNPTETTAAEEQAVLDAANLVTLARTGVEYDYRGNVIDAHAPELPTRFSKQLTQILRGGVAIGMDRADALRLAIRCARDSMPPLRLAIIDDLAQHPDSEAQKVRKRLDKPRSTVIRQLEALHMLGVVTVDERKYGEGRTQWFYSLDARTNPKALDPKSCPDLSVHTPNPIEEGERRTEGSRIPSDISGQLRGAQNGALSAATAVLTPTTNGSDIAAADCPECGPIEYCTHAEPGGY